MLKRYVTLAAVIGLGVLVPSVPARAARKRTHQCTITTRSAFLEQDDGFPNVGTTAQAAGVVDATCDGQKTHGLQEFKTTITDISGGGGGGVNVSSASVGSQVPVAHFTTEGITYYEQGTLKVTGTGGATPQTQSTFTTSGQTKITGGTGLYRGATGDGQFTGSIAPTGVINTQGTTTETLTSARGGTRTPKSTGQRSPR
jgi:hypothetical protein